MPIVRLSGSTGSTASAVASSFSMDSSAASIGDGVFRTMVIHMSTPRTVTTPAGWTEVIDATVGSGSIYMAWHWATDAEAIANTSFTWTLSGTTFLSYRCNNWSGVDPTTPFDVNPFTSTHTFSDVQWDVPGMTVVTPGAMCFWAVGYGPIASSASRVLTPSVAGGNTWTVDTGGQRNGPTTGTGTGQGIQTMYELRAAAGATGTRHVDISGSSLAATLWRSVAFALRPAPTTDPGDWFETCDWSAPAMTDPGDVLGIGPSPAPNHFAVQLAVPGAAAIETHDQTEIGSGYRFYPWVYGKPDGDRVIMRAPVSGPVTSGATSCRCEWRELDAAGVNAAFDALTGTHTLHGRIMIRHAPPNNPGIVLAQLHNGTADRLTFLTQLVSSTWRLRFRLNGTSVAGELATAGQANIQDIPWEYKIQIANNVASFYLNDMVTPVYTSGAAALTSTGSASWYFKTGCYLQTPADASVDAATEYGEVELWDLSHSHA
jgi:hypothetical protein